MTLAALARPRRTDGAYADNCRHEITGVFIRISFHPSS
jgi:hypothetical protein